MSIKELTSLTEIKKLFNLYLEIYENLSKDKFHETITWMHANNLKFITYSENKKALAAAIYWQGYRFHCGQYIQIDSLIVSKNHRNKKIAQKLLNYVENIAIEKNIAFYCLDVYSNNSKAIKLYSSQNFAIKCFHMMKKI